MKKIYSGILAVIVSLGLNAQTLQVQIAGGNSTNPDTLYFCTDSCYQLSALVTGGTPPYTYQWTGSNNTVISTSPALLYCMGPNPSDADTLILEVWDSGNGYDVSMPKMFKGNFTFHPVCLVTVDTATGKNMIVWDQTNDTFITHYNVYKESTSPNVYNMLVSHSVDSMTTFTDTLSNPAQTGARYRLTTLNNCGDESASPFTSHRTIHLAISAGIPPAWNLMWSQYEGVSVNTYRIWRGTASGAQLIDSVQSSFTSYTDLNPPPGVLYYVIEMMSNTVCNPGMKMVSPFAVITSSLSNRAITVNAGIPEEPLSFICGPNPAGNEFIISGLKAPSELFIYSLVGEQIYKTLIQTPSHKVDLKSLDAGIYFFEIRQGKNKMTRKVIVE